MQPTCTQLQYRRGGFGTNQVPSMTCGANEWSSNLVVGGCGCCGCYCPKGKGKRKRKILRGHSSPTQKGIQTNSLFSTPPWRDRPGKFHPCVPAGDGFSRPIVSGAQAARPTKVVMPILSIDMLRISLFTYFVKASAGFSAPRTLWMLTA